MTISETSGEIKDKALATLKGKWAEGAVATLIYYAVMIGIPTVLTVACADEKDANGISTIIQLAFIPLAWGFTVFFLRMVRGRRPDYGWLFEGFKRWWWLFKAYILVGIFTFLWTLLLIVPGIMKSYSYSMVPFILEDNPDITAGGAIDESSRLMDGHRMRLFILDLSFIGWWLLSLLTLGIGFLFLVPYWQAARAHFYAELKANDDEVEAITAGGSADETSGQQAL